VCREVHNSLVRGPLLILAYRC